MPPLNPIPLPGLAQADSISLYQCNKQKVKPCTTPYECLFFHQSLRFGTAPGNHNQPAPILDGNTRAARAHSRSGSSYPHGQVISRVASSPHQPVPSSRNTTDATEFVTELLKKIDPSTGKKPKSLKIAKQGNLWNIIHQLFALVHVNVPLSEDAQDVWKHWYMHNNMVNETSSPRAYEDSQGHPVAEQLHGLVRTFLSTPGVLNEEGLKRLAELDPVHSTADQSLAPTSDEACYAASQLFDTIPYLLEVKRVDVGRESLERIDDIEDISLRITDDGVIDWSSVPDLVSERPGYRDAKLLLTRVSATSE